MKNFPILLFLFLSLSIPAQNQGDSIPPRKIDAYAAMFKSPLEGKPLINFSGQRYNDSTIQLESYKGNVIVINFWYVGCPPCLGEISDLNRVYDTFRDSTVKIISVANNSAEQIRKFMAGMYSTPVEPIKYTVVTGAADAIKAYNISSYPTTVLIDKKGVIRLVYSGATMSSLQNYVQFYGDKGLSKEWKQILSQGTGQPQMSVSTLLTQLISELLKE